MRKLFMLLFAVCLFGLAACGNAGDTTAPPVALADVAAEAVPAEEIVPADVTEVVIATEEMLLGQPMEGPIAQPASGDPSAEPALETDAPAEVSEEG